MTYYQLAAAGRTAVTLAICEETRVGAPSKAIASRHGSDRYRTNVSLLMAHGRPAGMRGSARSR